MATRIQWHGEEAKLYVRRRSKAVLILAAQDMVGRARELLSVPGPEPSAPGEPPHRQTGWLQDSVRYEIIDDQTAWVGTDLDYGWYLEMGTRRGIAPRPWLRPAMATVWQKIGQYVRSLGR